MDKKGKEKFEQWISRGEDTLQQGGNRAWQSSGGDEVLQQGDRGNTAWRSNGGDEVLQQGDRGNTAWRSSGGDEVLQQGDGGNTARQSTKGDPMLQQANEGDDEARENLRRQILHAGDNNAADIFLQMEAEHTRHEECMKLMEEERIQHEESIRLLWESFQGTMKKARDWRKSFNEQQTRTTSPQEAHQRKKLRQPKERGELKTNLEPIREEKIEEDDCDLEEKAVVTSTTESWQLHEEHDTEKGEWRYEIKISSSKSGESSRSKDT